MVWSFPGLQKKVFNRWQAARPGAEAAGPNPMRETTDVFCGGRPLSFSLNRKKSLKAEFEQAALPHLCLFASTLPKEKLLGLAQQIALRG